MKRLVPFLFLLVGMVLAGCQDGGSPKSDPKPSKEKPAAKKSTHSGSWWCEEHGIPEDDCLACKHNEADLRRMKDWCEEHETAKSQCFKCNPALREHFAAIYRAKYPGKEPPKADKN
jgi:hypothetical protein